ncbi:MAG: 30S ribosomal protein S1 [Ardenticatenaceae bacterium]
MSEHETHDSNSVGLNWFDEYLLDVKDIHPGQILTGTIMQVRANEVLIDVGTKSEGLVDSKELSLLSEEELATVKEGADIRVYVARKEGKDGHPVLSIHRAKMEQDWEFVEQASAENQIFDAKVTGSNKGGLIVHIGQVRAFVPASQVSSLRREGGEGNEEYQRRLNGLVGQSLKFKVLELERNRNRLILSEREAQREWRRDRKERLLSSLNASDVIKGKVSSVAKFGAFVDLGGADGLLHLSELSWGRVNHPSEVVQVGDELEVYVLSVDRERRRIGLSLKRLQPEPWSQFVLTHQLNDEVDAVITHLASFGAFARLVNQGVEGLIHVSEITHGHIQRPDEAVKVGDKVRVKIIRIEPERKRLGLSMRLSKGQNECEIDLIL